MKFKTFAVSKTATLGNQNSILYKITILVINLVVKEAMWFNTAKSPVNVNQSYSIKPGTKLYTLGNLNKLLAACLALKPNI